jgi:hypothetical protein
MSQGEKANLVADLVTQKKALLRQMAEALTEQALLAAENRRLWQALEAALAGWRSRRPSGPCRERGAA